MSRCAWNVFFMQPRGTMGPKQISPTLIILVTLTPFLYEKHKVMQTHLFYHYYYLGLTKRLHWFSLQRTYHIHIRTTSYQTYFAPAVPWHEGMISSFCILCLGDLVGFLQWWHPALGHSVHNSTNKQQMKTKQKFWKWSGKTDGLLFIFQWCLYCCQMIFCCTWLLFVT